MEDWEALGEPGKEVYYRKWQCYRMDWYAAATAATDVRGDARSLCRREGVDLDHFVVCGAPMGGAKGARWVLPCVIRCLQDRSASSGTRQSW